MSITRQHIQEDLSVAYISAVAAKAGFDCGNPNRHDYGVDLEINSVKIDKHNKRKTSGMPLRIQAKASQNYQISKEGKYISYKLEIDNYNMLIDDTEGGPPCILVLYCMPVDDKEWLDIRNGQTTDGYTTLKHCGYWVSLRGDEESDNGYNIRIKIPRTQVFNESSLKLIMENVRGGRRL
jgi:hypothetical protein